MLGPGPSRRRSDEGSGIICPEDTAAELSYATTPSAANCPRIVSTICGVAGRQRPPGQAADVARHLHRRLQSRRAVGRRHRLGERRDPALQRQRLGVAARHGEVVQPHHQVRDHARRADDAADGAHAEAGVERRGRSDQHAEPRRAQGDQVRDLREVAARVLDARDVGMERELRDRLGRHVHAGEDRHVVRQHRDRRRVGDTDEVADEQVRRHLALEVAGRAHQDDVRAGRGRALHGGDGRARRFLAGPDDHRLARGHRLAGGGRHAERLVGVEHRRLAVRAEDEQAGQAGLHPLRDVGPHRVEIDLVVFEGSGNRGEDSAQVHDFFDSPRQP